MFHAKQLEERTCLFEGFRAKPYLCPLNVWTIGYGETDWAGERVTQDTPEITETEARNQVRADLFEAVVDCQRIYGEKFGRLSDVQQEVLIHMAFQLGGRKLSKFTRMTAAVLAGDTDAWIREMQDSLWWKQTPRPARALADAIGHDKWLGQWHLG